MEGAERERWRERECLGSEACASRGMWWAHFGAHSQQGRAWVLVNEDKDSVSTLTCFEAHHTSRPDQMGF